MKRTEVTCLARALLCIISSAMLMSGCGGGNSATPNNAPAVLNPPPPSNPPPPNNPPPANPSPTTISASVSTLVLSVANTALNPALTGNPRTITITNTGNAAAFDLAYSVAPALPSGTTLSSTCAATLAVGTTCTLSVAPGATPSAAPGDTNPQAITVSVAGSNTNTLAPTISLLSYGSVYQSGYVFAIDDTTPASGNIGGKVAALTDASTGVMWGTVGTATNAQSLTDGPANTQEIITTLGSSPANAANVCAARTDGGYNDWYLPAICEMAGAGGSASCAANQQNMQTSLIDTGNLSLADLSLLNSDYWSSTEYSGNPPFSAWIQEFASGGGSFQFIAGKTNALGVRCARAMTN